MQNLIHFIIKMEECAMININEVLQKNKCIISIVGSHAGESIVEIYNRKIEDINKVGKTFWMLSCNNSVFEDINKICDDEIYVFFIKSSSNNGAKPTIIKNKASGYEYNNKHFLFPNNLSPVTGNINQNSVALVMDELITFNEITAPIIDLWRYSDTNKKPLSFTLGNSTLPCFLNEIYTKGMKSRYRVISAIGHLTHPFCVKLVNNLQDYVKCAICGKCMKHLTNHIVKVHDMSIDNYKTAYPNNPIISEYTRQVRIYANQNKFHGKKRTYNKRYVYLLPDGNYASKADEYKRAWNSSTVRLEHKIDASTINYIPKYQKPYAGIENEDFVVCKICGERKRSLTQHLRKCHNLTKDEYIKQYQGEIYSKKAKKAFHLCTENKWKTQRKEKYIYNCK